MSCASTNTIEGNSGASLTIQLIGASMQPYSYDLNLYLLPNTYRVPYEPN